MAKRGRNMRSTECCLVLTLKACSHRRDKTELKQTDLPCRIVDKRFWTGLRKNYVTPATKLSAGVKMCTFWNTTLNPFTQNICSDACENVTVYSASQN